MASTPAFANVPRLGIASVSTANTNRDGTGTIADIITGVAAGTRVDRVVLKATGDPADSVVTLFIYDGSTYQLFDEFDIGNPAAGATTDASYRFEKAYTDLVLPSASFKLAAAITVALTSGVIKVFAFGADLT